MGAALLVLFGALALILASIGIYRRAWPIPWRNAQLNLLLMGLAAQPRRCYALVLRQGSCSH